MKKFFILAALLIAATCVSAEVKQEGNTFSVISSASKKSEPKATEYKYKDGKGVDHTIYLSANGRAFVLMTSKNGKEYKKYLGEEISRKVCELTGTTYVEQNKK